jgi:starch phosphorylase
VRGIQGSVVPVFLLDSDLPENTDEDRTLTHFLYGGDQRYRLGQEIVLGIGGVRMLEALGYKNVRRYHMNEGHASLLALELLDQQAKRLGHDTIRNEDVDAVKKLCVFTTHTPVAAGFDQFPLDLVERVLGRHELDVMKDIFCCDGTLNMTFLALNLSHYINGVAKKHGETSQLMFAQYKVDSITNGVHAAHWVCPPMQNLFDRHIPDWKQDNFGLRYALSIPHSEVWSAHAAAKQTLIKKVNSQTNAGLNEDVFTIGFARRAAEYKRADVFFHDIERLKKIAAHGGAFQVLFSGKAHPQDQGGKEMIRRVIQAFESLRGYVKGVYLENYDMDWAKALTSGVDLWLNTPQPPLEASGTSGMKAALNGVPSLSVKDGWWTEGHIENVTGWAIGPEGPEGHGLSLDADSIYHKLEESILPMFYRDRDRFIEIMRHSIALNGSFFNTQRMMQQYVLKAYLPA